MINAFTGLLYHWHQDVNWQPLSSHFLTSLAGDRYCYENVCNASLKWREYCPEILVFPIHSPGHWYLIVADRRDDTITAYDSVHGRHIDTLLLISRYLGDDDRAFRRPVIQWSLHETVAPLPYQLNAVDCGVFTLMQIVQLIDTS